MTESTGSADLIMDSILVIAGLCLIAGILLGVVATFVWLDRRADRLDVMSIERQSRARSALGRLAGR